MSEKVSEIAYNCIKDFSSKYIDVLLKEIVEIVKTNIEANLENASFLHGSFESIHILHFYYIFLNIFINIISNIVLGLFFKAAT